MLEWKETESELMNWYEAKALEKDGWRLPTRAELVDSYDNKMEGFQSSGYWSSSTYILDTDYAWGVSYGSVSYYYKTYNGYVRLCREVEE